MSKFKYINKKGQVSVILKPAANEQINNGEAAYLAGNFFRGFLRPAADGSGNIIFSGAQGMPLSRFLRYPVNKDQFYIIIAQLLEAYKTIVSVNLDPTKVNLDMDLITINENTGEIYLIYQPMINLQSPNQGFMQCFAQICSALKYISPQDQASIGGFVAFARQLSVFSVENIENYIMSASPLTYNHVQRRILAETPAAPVSVQNNVPAEPPVPDISPSPQIPESNSVPVPAGQENPGADYHMPAESSGIPENIPENIPEEQRVFPKLVRRSTGETVIIDKETFVIGKERAKVDYAVTENKTVSRVHATIFCRKDGCVIVDNNSTNRTFINGSPIPAASEIRINSGDVLKLSNEEFDFIET